MFADPDMLRAAMSYAGKGGLIVGALDAASGGVAGKTLVPRSIKNQLVRQAINAPLQAGVQGAMGGAGEAGKQLAQKGQIDQPGQVLAEMVGEWGTAPVEVLALSKDARQVLVGRNAVALSPAMQVDRRSSQSPVGRKAPSRAEVPPDAMREAASSRDQAEGLAHEVVQNGVTASSSLARKTKTDELPAREDSGADADVNSTLPTGDGSRLPGAADGNGYRPSGNAISTLDPQTVKKARILQGEPVAILLGNEAPRGFALLRAWASKLFADAGGVAVHPELGEVVLDERAVRDSMAHGMNPSKAVSFAAVKAVVEGGALVLSAQHDRDATSFYISAPVEIDEKGNVVTVLVKKDPNTQRMYLHSVSTKERLLNTRYSGTDTKEGVERSGKATSGDVASVIRGLLTVNLKDVSGDASTPAMEPEVPTAGPVVDAPTAAPVGAMHLTDKGTLSVEGDPRQLDKRLRNAGVDKVWMWTDSVWVAPEQAARAQQVLAQPQPGAAADAVRQPPPPVQMTMREGGMLDVEGDTQAVRQWLEGAGIPKGAMMDGPGKVVVTAGSVEQAKQALAGSGAVSVASDRSPLTQDQDLPLSQSQVQNAGIDVSHFTVSDFSRDGHHNAENLIAAIDFKKNVDSTIKYGNISIEDGAAPDLNEFSAGKRLAALGYNVRHKITANDKGIPVERTADLYVEGVGDVDVYTPRQMKESTILRGIEGKKDQAVSVFIQMDTSRVDVNSLLARLWGKPNLKSIESVFIQRLDGSVNFIRRPEKEN